MGTARFEAQSEALKSSLIERPTEYSLPLPLPPSLSTHPFQVDYDHSHLPTRDNSYYHPDLNLKHDKLGRPSEHSWKLGLKSGDNRDQYLDTLNDPDHYEHRDKKYYKRSPERIKKLTPAYVAPKQPDIPTIVPPNASVAGVPSDHQPYKKGNIIELRTVRRPGRERSISNSTPDLLTPAPVALPAPPTHKTEAYEMPGWLQSGKMKTLLKLENTNELEKSETILREGSKKHIERKHVEGAAGVVTVRAAPATRGKGGAGAHLGEEQGNFFSYSEYPEFEDNVGKPFPLKEQRYMKRVYNHKKESKVEF